MELKIGRQVNGKLLPCSHLPLLMISALLYFCLPSLLCGTTVRAAADIQWPEDSVYLHEEVFRRLPKGHASESNLDEEDEGERKHIIRRRRAAGVPVDMGRLRYYNNRRQPPLDLEYQSLQRPPSYRVNRERQVQVGGLQKLPDKHPVDQDFRRMNMLKPPLNKNPGPGYYYAALGLQPPAPLNPDAPPQTRERQGVRNFIKQIHVNRVTDLYKKYQGIDEWTVDFWDKENTHIEILCPKETFIAEIQFGLLRSDVMHKFTIKDKIDRKLSPEKTEAKYPTKKTEILPIKTNREMQNFYLSKWNEAVNEINEEAQKQSSLSETGCDPIIYCLGHQSCHFRLRPEVCAELTPIYEKMGRLRMSYKCVHDSSLGKYLENEEDRKVVRKEMDETLHLRYSDGKSNDSLVVIELDKVSEEEIFDVSCPPVSDAYKLG